MNDDAKGLFLRFAQDAPRDRTPVLGELVWFYDLIAELYLSRTGTIDHIELTETLTRHGFRDDVIRDLLGLHDAALNAMRAYERRQAYRGLPEVSVTGAITPHPSLTDVAASWRARESTEAPRPEVTLCVRCNKQIDIQKQQYVIVRRSHGRDPETRAHAECEQRHYASLPR
jgi:hypothetical protein